jgi:hypothetical protein
VIAGYYSTLFAVTTLKTLKHPALNLLNDPISTRILEHPFIKLLIMPKTPLYTIVIAILMLPGYAFAQKPVYEAGFNVGAYVYQGELTPSRLGAYNTLRPGMAFWGSKRISDKIALRANFAFGSLKADDSEYSSPEWRRQRNLKFTTPVSEVSLLAIWNIYAHETRLSPYLFAGLGYSFLDIERDYSRFNSAYFANQKSVIDGLAADAATKTPGGIAVVPLGGGIRYAFNDKLSLHAETNYRLIESDYLDGFSKVGNPERNDHYQSTSVGLIYSFGKNKDMDCPKW